MSPEVPKGTLVAAPIKTNMDLDISRRVSNLREAGVKPTLMILSDDNRPNTPTAKYMDLKRRVGYKAGIRVGLQIVSEDIEDLGLTIGWDNANNDIDGMIVQLPLLAVNGMEKEEGDALTDRYLNMIDPVKDVDGLSARSLHYPATAEAVMSMIEHYIPDYASKVITLRGIGKLVGGPLHKLLLPRIEDPANNLLVCDASTHAGDVAERLDAADIIVTATGSGHSLVPGMFSDNTSPKYIFDAGTAEQSGLLVGDVSDQLRRFAAEKGWSVTPAEGGVGPLTVRHLLSAVVKAAELRLQAPRAGFDNPAKAAVDATARVLDALRPQQDS